MSASGPPAPPGAWHQALVYAVTGARRPDLGRQGRPDLTALLRLLEEEPGRRGLAAHVQQVVAAGGVWPHPVPPDLMSGLGYAQLTAALTTLRSGLGLTSTAAPRPRVGTDQPVTADLRRLLDEVPPHHGS